MSELTNMICREIADQGVISFERFMALSLYCPRLGYYAHPSKHIGCQGDFYTSVSVGGVFGELLAFQFIRWLAELARGRAMRTAVSAVSDELDSSPARGTPSCAFQLVEAGAHNGQLAFDILTWIEKYEPAWLTNLEYWILEPSSELQHWQQEKLGQLTAQVRWFSGWESMPRRGICGIIFSNELLDAFPVHRIGWDTKTRRWFEWGIGWAADHFVWKRMPATTSRTERHQSRISWPQLPEELLAVLPDNFTTELSPAAERWWEQSARALLQGKLMTLDYGLSANDFFVPARARGTLRAYTGHHYSADLLADPGGQDLTAHVNFTAFQRVGEGAGLVTEGFMTQAQFLTRIVERVTDQNVSFNLSTLEQRRQFQTLTHPEHLGRPLKVLVQSRS